MRVLLTGMLLVLTACAYLPALEQAPTGDLSCAGDGGDAGDCAELGGEAGPLADVPFPSDEVCPQLVTRVCGGGDECADAPACVAARVLDSVDEADQCTLAYDNTVSWPDCVPGPCNVLVTRVCGAEAAPGRCEDAPGCSPARDLLERSSSEDAEERRSALSSCNAALEDDVVFVTCR